ncbi:MAG: alpha-galactosidase [Gluconacetobacter diazotrophicus]|nr:alpha-galactosidase [Gluconacetobacter diazotrophicus]
MTRAILGGEDLGMQVMDGSAAGDGATAPVAVLRLDGARSTLLLLRRFGGLPEIVHWGSRLPPDIAATELGALRAGDRPHNGPDQWEPCAALLPTFGGTAFGQTGLAAFRDDGSAWTATFAVEAVEEQPGRLVVRAVDHASELELRVELALDDTDVLVMRNTLRNLGPAALRVERLVSGTVILPAAVEAVHTSHGAWGQEFGRAAMSLAQGTISVESRRNRSHDHFPGLAAGLPGTGDESGQAWGLQLGWSGAHRFTAERLEDGSVQVMGGEFLHPGEVVLAPGEALETPPLFAAWSANGFGGVARAFHAHARRSVLRWPAPGGYGPMRPRPVLLNSWEGNRFALSDAALRTQAEQAAALGIERYVLDDGWFGGRRNDKRGLGDWHVSPAVFPQGLRPLADHVRGLGMEFGLWFEPEMVSPDSDLFRARPDWVLHVAGRPLRTARHQLVLDIARREVADHLFEAIAARVDEIGVDYIKWDHNRDLVEAGDVRGRAAYRQQVEALYALWRRLAARHPGLEIESCASGGGRADLGALLHTQRIWTSDNTDALDRLRMQRSAFRFLPPEVCGTHVSASPNHQTGRRSSLDFRAAVALFGHMGVELDPRTLDADESETLARWIALHKRLRPLLHGGHCVFGEDTPSRVLQGVVSPDRTHAVFLLAATDWPPQRRPHPVRLPGLDPARRYGLRIPAPVDPRWYQPSPDQQALAGEGKEFGGALLSEIGVSLPQMDPGTAWILECQPA